MFDQGSQIVQLVKQVGAGPGQSQNLQNNSVVPPGSEAPNPADSANFGKIVKTSQAGESSALDFKNSIMLGKENLSGRTVLFPAGGLEQSMGSSGMMSSAVKNAWKNLRTKMGDLDKSMKSLDGEEFSFQDTVKISTKLTHLSTSFHLTFTSLQKTTQSFDTILRAQ